MWLLLKFDVFPKHLIRFCIVFVLLVCCGHNGYSEVVTYPSPGDLSNVPHLKESTDYTVKVNGQFADSVAPPPVADITFGPGIHAIGSKVSALYMEESGGAFSTLRSGNIVYV